MYWAEVKRKNKTMIVRLSMEGLIGSVPHIWGGSEQILPQILLDPFLCVFCGYRSFLSNDLGW